MKRGRQSTEQNNEGEVPKKHQKVREEGARKSNTSKSSPPKQSSSSSTSSSSVTTQQQQPQQQIPQLQYQEGEVKALKIEDALAFLEQVKRKFANQPEIFDEFLSIMRDYKTQTIDTPGVVARVSELFKGHSYLILGFNAFLPPGYRIRVTLPGDNQEIQGGYRLPETQSGTADSSSSSSTTTAAPTTPSTTREGEKVINFEQAVSYVTKIKNRFSDQPNTYKTFLNILHRYQKEQSTIRRVYEQVANLFRDHPDLLEEFIVFLPEKPDILVGKDASNRYTGSATLPPTSSSSGRRITRGRRAVPHAEPETTTSGKKKTGKGAKAPSISASAAASATGVAKKGAKAAVEDEYEEDDYENRREFAQANVVMYGPSYRVLPETMHQPTCSNRTELCRQVLNDNLVSMAAGSEESSFHRKSICDEIVFQCEDDRTELDIVIEQNMSTIRFLEELLKKMEADPNYKFKLESLRDIHRASIARIYAEKANEVLEGMRKNPLAAIPVILPRLKQKEEEWKHARTGLNKFWREIYEKNHQRSMEEQCAIFKQMDKKALNPKTIINDINDRHVYNKELQILMNDELIHHVIYSLLESVGELGENDMEKVRLFWLQVIIPFFNLKVRPAEPSSADDLQLHHLSDLIRKRDQLQGGESFAPILEKDLGKKTVNHVLFGNVPMILFFRYYIYAYERLSKAKELAVRQLKNLERPSTTGDIVKQHENMNSNAVVDASTSSGAVSKDFFKLFLRNLTQYFSDEIDTATFEDECKKSLGHRSWIVFTFDKLFANLQKQLQNINADEACTELANAFKYEYRRVNKFLDNAYFVQAHKIVGNVPFYVMNYNWSKHRFSLDVVEAPEIDTEKVVAEERGLKYIQQFLSAGTNSEVEKKSHVFLRRNKRTVEAASTNSPLIMNGLECKVCIGTLKLFFVEDTSDLLYRKKSLSYDRKSQESKKSQRFTKFLSEKQATI